jgi:Collagen triple helix repeat (20 copies)
MLNARDIKFFAIGAVIVASGLSVLAAVNIPNTFAPNTPIKAEEVNANFSSLKASFDALQASAGVADGAVTAPKLSTLTPAANGKFLSYNGSSLVWVDGTAGVAGLKGDKGDTGAPGAKGDTGVQGLKGDPGATGAQGLKGDTGATGAQGLKGDTGAQGLTGNTGATGAAGVSGYEQVVTNLTSQSLAANSESVLLANCPAGKLIVGGGAVVFNASGRWIVDTSGPTSNTQWAIVFTNITGSTISAGTIRLTAICITAL